MQVILVGYFVPRSIFINSEYPLKPYEGEVVWVGCLFSNVGRKEKRKHLEQVEIFPPNIFSFTIGMCTETEIS